ncbi:transglutaminase family protein [Arenibaculum pallidiluteum]|uniref:transglutaminase family protein n=1 Tax=Arenibaculum pallidiluteum TaxID=2812559 RepID=UPI001A95DD8D|nr:transglutaminase family protein [Arenibaculum pallidiluteum]
MTRLSVRHATTYSYAKPVRLGDHRLMFRPHDSHDLRLIGTGLTITPPATAIRWLHDVFGNSVAIVCFDVETTRLEIVSTVEIELFPPERPDFPIEPYARTYPFSYSAEEVPDLARTLERHYPDPDHRVDAWAKQFVVPDGTSEGGLIDTAQLLARMTLGIKDGFTYVAREAEGTQTPVETLQLGSGTCRDFALLMMEAVRSLGFAARFVSGYLYDPAVDGAAADTVGAGATHAWVQVYLPGAGWVEFDPTNGIVGSQHLIRVAVTRDPSQAIPLAGTWFGAPSDYLGMTVSVEVTARRNAGEPAGSPAGPPVVPSCGQAAPVPPAADRTAADQPPAEAPAA